MKALALVALLWAGAAQAQSVVVRGGEHADFTRLVLRIPDGAGWALDPAPGGFELQLPDSAVFDLRRAFDRIPRSRVRALLPLGRGRLALSVSCDCHAQVGLFPGAGLVIDVVDGPAMPGGLAPGGSTPDPLAPNLPPLPDALAEAGERPPTTASAGPLPMLDLLASADAARVARTEAAILESVAAAATQGLLDVAPAQDLPEPKPTAGPPQPEAPVAEPPAPQEEPEASEPAEAPPAAPPPSGADAAAPRPGLAFRTGADTNAATQPSLGATGTACLPQESFDLAAWAGSGEFDIEVATRLRQLSDDRDRLDPEAVEALARTYLAFGFGREAAAALDTDGGSSRARDGLRLLARLVDGEPVPQTAFEDQAGCLGPVALWRALARGTLQGTDERERSALTIALRALPTTLRGPIALRLANLLLDAGDALGAEEIAALAKEGGTEALITQAVIAKETEGPAPALAELEGIAKTDARMTPDGLVELIDLTIAQGRAVPEETLELARALRFEQGGQAGRRLLLAEARALTSDSRFEEALVLLDQEQSAHPRENLDDALTATVAALTERLDDAPFLELALGELPPDLPSEARDTVAQRLADLGFPDEAWTLRATQGARALPLPVSLGNSLPGLGAIPSNDTASHVLASGTGHGSTAGQALDWSQPPPAAERPSGDAPADARGGMGPSGTGEADRSAMPAPEAPTIGLLDDPGGSGLAETLTSLAARRALLDQAGAARARAAALLDQALPE